jgi:hypothetical protein
MSFRLVAIAFACQLTAQVPARVDLERQLWTSIKRALIGRDGDEYFQSSMKDAMLPRLKGTLISVVPNDSGNALVLGLADSITPEVALLVHDLPAELATGASIEFEGVPTGFTKDPFLVTFQVDEVLNSVTDSEENGVKMSESRTWIVTEQTRVLFLARATTYDLPIFQTHFAPIISSAVVP